ncbi:hypothetical protein [Aureimonas sp. ME7]|uniref:hypothetical protein n=1 Tax=Aureimonas sp. ME7 TaxID=2744252 RepID=UPI0015F5CC55|nr:hypothetical protein [Aureimonas sp. ME7]
MRAKTAAKKTTRYVLLGLCIGVAVVLAILFVNDARDGRSAREVERIQGAQERIREVTPTPVPAAPAQE